MRKIEIWETDDNERFSTLAGVRKHLYDRRYFYLNHIQHCLNINTSQVDELIRIYPSIEQFMALYKECKETDSYAEKDQ